MCLFNALGLYAQKDTDSVMMLMSIEVNAEYKGGDSALYHLIYENLQYPQLAKDSQVTGTAYIRFTVDTFGRIYNLISLNKPLLGYGLDEAAKDALLLSSGNWRPASILNKKVEMKFIIPIKFEL